MAWPEPWSHPIGPVVELVVNGKQHQLEGGNTLASLLQQLAVTEGRFAVEVNGEIVPKSQHHGYVLRDNDAVEIVRAIGGG